MVCTPLHRRLNPVLLLAVLLVPFPSEFLTVDDNDEEDDDDVVAMDNDDAPPPPLVWYKLG